MTWCLVWLGCIAALAVSVPLAFAASNRISTTNEPGTASVGRLVFVQFCGKCHTLSAAGSLGTLGPNLDQDKVTYAAVVSAIEQGVGGIQAEYVLRDITFNQIYDVAKFVVTASRCATPKGGCMKSSESQ
jgi:mono/diheme cytochrome c family protein